MKQRTAMVIISVAVVLIVVWRNGFFRSLPKPSAVEAQSSVSSSKIPISVVQKSVRAEDASTASRSQSSTDSVASLESAAQKSVVTSSPIPKRSAPTLPELTSIPPSTVLENMRGAFRQYAARFGGNPVGTNPEITAALNGDNSKQVQFLNSEDGLRVDENGELVDSWGTPFFFHQLSAKEMEIHSAGPDHIMWTDDDLVVK